MAILYDIRCNACDEEFEEWRALKNYNDPGTCVRCGGTTRRVTSHTKRAILHWQQGWPGENIRNNRDALKELEKSNKVRADIEREMKMKDI